MKTLWDKIVEFDTPQQQLWRSAKRHSSSASENSDMAEMKRLSDVEWIDILYQRHYIYDVVFTAAGGDLTLVITGGKSHEVPVWEKDAKIALVVCSKKLDKALPGWRGRVAQTNDARSPGHLPIAELAEGTPAVFQHLIAAAHFSPTEDLPAFIIEDGLNLKEIYEIAMLSHKYCALHLIAGNVLAWHEELVPTGWELDELDENYCNQREYLWIAYEFGWDRVFHHICFNLAYVTKIVFKNPSSMPPGIYGQIYNCREAYAEALLSSISGYRQKLLEATAPGAKVSNYVCKHASQADLCAVEQLQILDLWIKHEGLEIGPEGHFYNSLWMSENRSLLDFFGSAPATEGLGGIHKGKFRGKCGLIHLARTILDEDNMRFLHWMAESGMKAQMATGDHKSYMAEQKRKLSR